MFNLEDLTESLQGMGIVDMFDPKRADMTNLTVPHYQVYETDLNRQDYLKITADGIELASFVTDGDDGKEDANQGPVKHADRPFLFFVMDRSVDLILYGGRVTNPKGWKIDNGGSRGKKGSKAGKVFLILILVGACAYFFCKWVYNLTVMQLSGFDAVPHVERCRDCRAWFQGEIEKLHQVDGPSMPVPSGPERYKPLVGDGDSGGL